MKSISHIISKLISGSSWLIDGDGTGESPKIDCSTSEIFGVEPTKCPTGYFCQIEDEGDISKQIPNRGICLRNNVRGMGITRIDPLSLILQFLKITFL